MTRSATLRRLALVLVVALVLAGGALVAWRHRSRRDGGALELAGTVETRTIQAGSLVGGRVEQVHVDEGDEVERGDALVTFEGRLLRRELAEQEARVAGARAELARVRAGPRQEEVERARVEWQLAELERARVERMLSSGVATQERYDAAAAQAEARRQLHEELRRGSRPEDVALAEATAAQHEARLGWLREREEELVVRAPTRAQVQALPVRPGDLVAPDEPVVELLELDQLWVRAYVPETRLGLVQVGQPAHVAVDTFPDRWFPGRVTRIQPRAEYTPRNVQTVDQREDLVFAIRIELAPDPILKAGMTALVRLVPDDGLPRTK